LPSNLTTVGAEISAIAFAAGLLAHGSTRPRIFPTHYVSGAVSGLLAAYSCRGSRGFSPRSLFSRDSQSRPPRL